MDKSCSAQDDANVFSKKYKIHEGEAASILLAMQLDADFLLISHERLTEVGGIHGLEVVCSTKAAWISTNFWQVSEVCDQQEQSWVGRAQ